MNDEQYYDKEIHEMPNTQKMTPDEVGIFAVNEEHKKIVVDFNEGRITYGKLKERQGPILDGKIAEIRKLKAEREKWQKEFEEKARNYSIDDDC